MREQILRNSEHVFERYGFTATGMDRLSDAANVSVRTLYKHVGSKNALITAVLEERSKRFFTRFDGRSVDALFEALDDWTRTEGARGCLFLRAEGETGGDSPEVSNAVTGYRRELRDLISRAVASDVGEDGRHALADQILVLFEGAISAASYRGLNAIDAARSVAALLVEQANRSDTCTS